MRTRFGVAAAALFAAAAQLAAESRQVKISPEVLVRIDADEITLSAKPLPGEGLDAFVLRLTDDARTKKSIQELNRDVRRLRRDLFVNVPYELLSPAYKKIAIEALFPEDGPEPRAWVHIVSAESRAPESLWRISEWFTGDGANYKKIMAAGNIEALPTRPGQSIRVPRDLLLPAFREAVDAAVAPAPVEAALEYGQDAQGRYALYRLRAGEALYSAVVVRFTGLLHAEDVNAKAAELARRSGITDVHAIPVGFGVKIPVQDLAAEFRPRDDPERIAEAKSRLEASQYANRVAAERLAGVTVVLDPGHGGRDTGALVAGIEEARYVYDIACRLERRLREETRAKVHMTLDRDAPCPARLSDKVAETRSARVRTTPPYALEDSTVGVNFRWYLANAVLRRAEKQGGSPEKTVFLSLHADSLHPAVRGAMVYVPGEKFLTGTGAKSGQVYAARREVRDDPKVTFTRRERVQAEGVSTDLAERIVGAFRQAELPLHAFAPVRRNVLRGGREWVPAILRYNRIPSRVLVEVGNLNNPEDRQLLVTRSYRDQVAGALVEALVAFFRPPGESTITAQAPSGETVKAR
ncbi:MAG TPA: N-acetylmuramoyl-L-alanine amidase [Thermoanaerobaculia bacterium]|jgi:N-acetylmuramoyl-L-alanine amidase